jgi:hypothetical protein
MIRTLVLIGLCLGLWGCPGPTYPDPPSPKVGLLR